MHQKPTIITCIQSIILGLKRQAFNAIKLKMVRNKIKDMSRKDFSINSSRDQNSYKSISDFKPLNNQYTSVKILDYQTLHLSQQENKRTSYILNYQPQQYNFLQIWMIREKPQFILPQDYPLSDYANRKISQYNQQALQTIRKFKFLTFMNNRINKNKSLFSQSVDFSKYQPSTLSKPLTSLPENLIIDAIQLSQLITKACLDRKSSKHQMYLIYKVIEKLMDSEDDLKQEGYFQVIKQLSSGKKQYFRLLCCLSTSIKLSTRMYLSVLNYIYQESTLDFQLKHSKQYSYCFFNIIKNFDIPRLYPPSVFQIYCYWNMNKIPITIAFPKQKVFFIEPYSLVEEFIEQIVKFYNLDKQLQYLLYIDNILLQRGPLLDKLAKHNLKQEVLDKYVNFKGYKGIIVLKNMNKIDDSSNSFNIMYNYTIYFYLRNLYKTSGPDMIKIAALILKSQINNQKKVEIQIQRLLPKRKCMDINKEKKQLYISKILKCYFQFNENKMEAKQEILKILQPNKGLLTHFFYCQCSIDNCEQFDIYLGLKWNKLILVEPYAGRIMKSIPYSMISHWGTSKTEICFKIDRLGDFNCFTPYLQVLSSIFQSYINYGISKIA